MSKWLKSWKSFGGGQVSESTQISYVQVLDPVVAPAAGSKAISSKVNPAGSQTATSTSQVFDWAANGQVPRITAGGSIAKPRRIRERCAFSLMCRIVSLKNVRPNRRPTGSS